MAKAKNNLRAEQLQREYAATLKPKPIVEKRIYGKGEFWIYRGVNKIFLTAPFKSFDQPPYFFRLDLEQINRIKFGQNIYHLAK